MALLPRMEDPEHIRLSAEAIGRNGPIRVNHNGSRYPMSHHQPGCGYYPNIERSPYVLGFPDAEAAEAAGHPACAKCRPGPKKPAGTRGPQKAAIHPKRVAERMGPREREKEAARKRRARRDMSPIEYERYLHKERERHRERRHRERQSDTP